MRFLTFFSIFLLLASCSSEVESTKPHFGNMTESVYASATVYPEDYYSVFPSASGVLEKIYVEEGDSVYKGQLLAKIRSLQSQLNVDNASIGLSLAEEKYLGNQTVLANILQEIELNKAQLSIDSTNYVRQSELWSQGIGSKAELEARQLKYESALSTKAILQKKFNQTKLELEASYKQSLNTLEQAKDMLADYYVRSTIDGKVFTINKEEGELILQQEPLASIGKSELFIIELSIDEVDIAKIELGQLCLISLDAYPNEVFESTISKIYPLKEARTQTFTLEALFMDAPSKLYAGLSGEANIVVAEEKGATWIPVDYLFETNKVKTEEGDVELTLGLRNIDFVQVLSGIDSTTVILKP